MPRTRPISHDPSTRCQGEIGATSWCLMLLDHMSNNAAYATSSWQTWTVESANVPTSTNTTVPGCASRNVIRRPTDRRFTIGQKTISKSVNTLRWVIRQLRRKNGGDLHELPRRAGDQPSGSAAPTSGHAGGSIGRPTSSRPVAHRASSMKTDSSVGSRHRHVADGDSPLVEIAEELRQALPRVVDDHPDAARPRSCSQDPRQVGQAAPGVTLRRRTRCGRRAGPRASGVAGSPPARIRPSRRNTTSSQSCSASRM